MSARSGRRERPGASSGPGASQQADEGGKAFPLPAGSGRRRSGRQLVRLALLRAVGRLYRGSLPAGPPGSILLIRPDHLGDVLFLTPALHDLRRSLPNSRLTLLVGPWSADVCRHNPDVDETILCAFPGFERRSKRNVLAPYRLLVHWARELHEREYDTALVMRFDHWWGAWLAAAAGIPRRVGYDWPETRPFLSRPVPYLAGRHEVVQNARLAAALAPGVDSSPGPLRYRVTPDARAWADSWLSARGVTPDVRLIAIHPGAGAPVKQWPASAWSEVADHLGAQGNLSVVLTGGGSERALTAAVAAGMSRPALDAAGETGLEQLAAVYERCDLVMGSDSGPLHLAVAMGRATLHLHGPVDADRFGPWGDPKRHVALRSSWLCAPCNRLDWPEATLSEHGCMATIAPADVLRHAMDLLAR